jgi:nucleoside-diphosphate-sugar epimerase
MDTKLKGKKIFITGGAGFISSYLIERLIDENEIIVYDNLRRNAMMFLNIQDHKHFRFIHGDVLDREKLTISMQGADICVHAAAIAGIYSVGENSTMTMKVNLIGSYNALEASVQNKVKRFVDFSTSEVYGPFIYRGKESDNTTLGPVGEKRWVYAVSKLASEHFAHSYGHDHNLEVVTVRPFNVFGPRQVGEGAVQQMINRALRQEDIIVYNDGTQIRSWCYVTDFVAALYNALFIKNARDHIFNIGNPQATITVCGLAETILRLTGSTSKIVFKPHPGPEVEIRVPDISKASLLLNYTPKISLEEGLIKTIDWYKNHL